MPEWVEVASNDSIKRLPAEIKINSILLPLIKRGKNPDIPRIIRDESRKILDRYFGQTEILSKEYGKIARKQKY